MAAMKNLVHDEEASSKPTNDTPEQSMCSHSRFWKLERGSCQAFRHTSMRHGARGGFSSLGGTHALQRFAKVLTLQNEGNHGNTRGQSFRQPR